MADVLADSGVFLLLHPSPHGGIRTRAQRYKFVAAATGFTRWLMEQIKRTDPVGDLARDIQFDTSWAPDLDSLDLALRVIDYASDEAKQALQEAWTEYAHSEPSSTYYRDIEDWFQANTEQGRETVEGLHEDYTRWCRAHNYRPRTRAAFSRRLTELGYPTTVTHMDGVSTRVKRLALVNFKIEGE